MTKIITTLIILLFMLTSHARAADIKEATDNFGPFGTMHI